MCDVKYTSTINSSTHIGISCLSTASSRTAIPAKAISADQPDHPGEKQRGYEEVYHPASCGSLLLLHVRPFETHDFGGVNQTSLNILQGLGALAFIFIILLETFGSPFARNSAVSISLLVDWLSHVTPV